MPRELLLPVPHAIADQVHHLLLEAVEQRVRRPDSDAADMVYARAFEQLADKLDTLAREAGVMGW